MTSFLKGQAYVQVERSGQELRLVGLTQGQPARPKQGSRLFRLVVQMPAEAFRELIPTVTIALDERKTLAIPVHVERPAATPEVTRDWLSLVLDPEVKVPTLEVIEAWEEEDRQAVCEWAAAAHAAASDNAAVEFVPMPAVLEGLEP